MRYGIETTGLNWYVVSFADPAKPKRLTQFAFGTADDAADAAERYEEAYEAWSARKA